VAGQEAGREQVGAAAWSGVADRELDAVPQPGQLGVVLAVRRAITGLQGFDLTPISA
jgi:hypothetical protein